MLSTETSSFVYSTLRLCGVICAVVVLSACLSVTHVIIAHVVVIIVAMVVVVLFHRATITIFDVAIWCHAGSF